jgi:hypothetical protein
MPGHLLKHRGILYSIAWLEIGNELCASPVSLHKFHDLCNQRLPFLGHIKLNAVQVVSHLGDIIPVPTMFCSTWKVLFILSCVIGIPHLRKPGFRLHYQGLLQGSLGKSHRRTG